MDTVLKDRPPAAAGSERSASAPAGSAARTVPAPARALPGAWKRLQRVNLSRHAFGLAPFREGEFGTGIAGPSPAHLAAVNALLHRFGTEIKRNLDRVAAHSTGPSSHCPLPGQLTVLKDRGQRVVEATELVWDFYYRLFSQRQTRLGGRLFAADRIALDCYQKVYTSLGRARSIPTPPPFSFMAAGLGPATYRRGIRVPQLGRITNLFPLVQLPHHRLLNPWTLGAIAHEVSHDLQFDLTLWEAFPREIERKVLDAGPPRAIARLWAQWHSELFSDLAGILFIGPAMVASLIDVMSRAPEHVARFNPRGVHPPIILRIPISLALLDRLGFHEEVRSMARLWQTLYPNALRRRLPPLLTQTFRPATDAAIEALVYTAYPQFGDRALVDVVSFGKREADMTREAAARLAAGTDPGIIPERFLIGASRIAVEQRLAPPGRIAENFYKALERR